MLTKIVDYPFLKIGKSSITILSETDSKTTSTQNYFEITPQNLYSPRATFPEEVQKESLQICSKSKLQNQLKQEESKTKKE